MAETVSNNTPSGTSPPVDAPTPLPGQRGKVYQAIKELKLDKKLMLGLISQNQVAEVIGCSQGAVSRAVTALREDEEKEKAEIHFEYRSEEMEVEEGWPIHINLYNLTDEELVALVDYFGEWRYKHFRDKHGKPYQFPAHQRKWTYLIFQHIRDGEMLCILSPPRHGKTELLIHIDTFLITRVNPNISIVKVAKSEYLAKQSTGSVLDHLSSSEKLVEECLPVGAEFRPTRETRRPWNAARFTVSNRDIIGLKTPTMLAVGMGGTLLSLDIDVFSLDDIEDHQTVRTPDMRATHREWFGNDVMSRKESQTAIIAIGSRQHPDDIWGHLINNPEWTVVIEKAHDDAKCTVEDGDNPDNWHKHVDCMLWPEVRDYEWLMGVKYDPLRKGSFVMTYQNEPEDIDMASFTIEIWETARDIDRITGHVPEPWTDEEGKTHQVRLIAGMDPSEVGHQAVFLWGYDVIADKLFAIDFENERGGGIPKARKQIREWYERYRVDYWIIESNLYRGGISQDELLRAYCNQHKIIMIDLRTQDNKWDDLMGVTAMADPMSKGLISIPWGDKLTQHKWDTYKHQLINFSRERLVRKRGRGAKSDLVMASWFPWETIKKWRRDYLEEQQEHLYMHNAQYPFVPADDIYNTFFPSMYSNVFTGAR